MLPMAKPNISATTTQSMRDYWRLYLAEGIAVSVLGLAAIIVPSIAGLFATVVFGWLLFIAGIVGLVATLRAREAPGFRWALLSAFVAVTLTYVLIAFFTVDGILVIILAIAHRRELSGKWEWMMVNGVTDLMLAGIIIFGFPGTLVWAFGLLVGIDMIFAGASLIAMALDARKACLADGLP
jgi:uncharacterized membrane protein HdeD (DUF308 family)